MRIPEVIGVADGLAKTLTEVMTTLEMACWVPYLPYEVTVKYIQ